MTATNVIYFITGVLTGLFIMGVLSVMIIDRIKGYYYVD